MADTRNLKRSICTSADIDKLSWFAEVLFYRLIVNCDECGRFDGRESVIKGTLFPLKRNLTLKNINDAVLQLESAGLVERYAVGGEPFLHLPTWSRYQRVRSEGKYPSPSDCGNPPQIAANPLSPSSPLLPPTPPNNTPISPNPDDDDKHKLSHGKNAPTREDVADFWEKNGLEWCSDTDFYNYCEEYGWEKITNWKSYARAFERNTREQFERLLREEQCAFDRIRLLWSEYGKD